MRICLIAANDQLRRSIFQVITEAGYTCYGFKHTYEALTRIQEHEIDPDIMITALSTPIMNGHSYIQAQINSFSSCRIPLILIVPTSLSTDLFITSGRTQYLVESDNISEINDIIEKIKRLQAFTKILNNSSSIIDKLL